MSGSDSEDVHGLLRLFRLVMDNIPQAVFWKDKNSVYLGCNRWFAQTTGMGTPDNVVGRTDFDFVWKRQEAEHFRRVDQRVMASGQAEYHIIESHVEPGDQEHWLDTNKVPLRNEAGEVVGILGTFEDITAQVKAERAVREREADLATTLDSMADGVVATNRNGKIVRMNPVAERLTRVALADALGQPLESVYATRERTSDDETRPVFEPARRGETDPCGHAVLLDSGDSTIEVSETVGRIRHDNGEFQGVVVVFRDVTEQRRMEQQLRHAQKMEAIGRLAGGIAHDFNNLLTGIVGSAELLNLREDTDAEIQELAATILRSSRRAAELVGRLLTFSRRGRLENAPLDVHSVLEDAVAILRRSVDRKTSLNIDLRAEEATVMGDAGEIQTAILNLCINARDAMPQGGVITIVTEVVELDARYCDKSTFDLVPGRYLQISVRDTGPGIAVQDLPKVFEPFYTTKAVGEGTGLGLAAAYGAATEHGGALTVDSEVGHGADFRILLPLTSNRLPLRPSSETPAPTGSGTILVADDEEAVRATAKRLLERLGYEVLLAVDGQDALRVFEEHGDRVSAVLLDMVMPRLSGPACLRELRKRNSDVPVVITTGYSLEAAGDLASRGAQEVLKKPFRTGELARVLARVLGG